MHIVPPQLATGSSATDADLADRRDQKRSLYVPSAWGHSAGFVLLADCKWV
jgi:hypothetical protein